MARRSVNGGTIISLELGKDFEAYYLGTREVTTNSGIKSVHDFIAYKDFTAITKNDKKEVVPADIKKGSQFSMWGATVINKAVKELAPGQWCYVKFDRTVPSKLGNDAKIYVVEVDDEIPNMDSGVVSELAAAAESAPVTRPSAEIPGNDPSIEDDLPF